MINNKEIYKLWAPKESIWSPWVRPVPFVFIDQNVDNKEYESFNIPSVIYLNNDDERFKNSALIIDLPGNKSINDKYGLFSSVHSIFVPIM